MFFFILCKYWKSGGRNKDWMCCWCLLLVRIYCWFFWSGMNMKWYLIMYIWLFVGVQVIYLKWCNCNISNGWKIIWYIIWKIFIFSLLVKFIWLKCCGLIFWWLLFVNVCKMVNYVRIYCWNWYWFILINKVCIVDICCYGGYDVIVVNLLWWNVSEYWWFL